MRNLIELLKNNATSIPKKVFLEDVNSSITFFETDNLSENVANAILNQTVNKNCAIAILLDRNVNVPVAMLGIMKSGNYYVVLDADSPFERLKKICDVLSLEAIITEQKYLDTAKNLCENLILIEDAKTCEIQIAKPIIKSNDLAYVLFTSGSTGAPKGTMITHSNVITYIEWFVSEFKISKDTVFGSQTPFYFSMSVSDFYASLYSGATYEIIPKLYFSFPIKLVEFCNSRKVNTIYWVPSAYAIVSKLNLLKYANLNYVEKVLFAGEIMPVKILNYWRNFLPNALYANLFGPTETTDICAFYVINRDFSDNQNLPIGKTCSCCNLMLIDNDGNLVTQRNTLGEIFVEGKIVAVGYYGDEEKTREVFVPNPNKSGDFLYKTGDLAYFNSYGELEYAGRKDFQIKHLGYRIELSEIEKNLNALDGVDMCACLFDKDKDSIVFVYSGKLNEAELIAQAKIKLPEYMIPNKVFCLSALPINQNGKIDRKFLADKYFI